MKLKVGAKVMLTYNIDVIDSLTNGAFGEVIGFQYTSCGTVKTVLVHFKNEKVGQSRRKNYKFLQNQFPGIPVTPIEKIEFNFSMSKKQTNNQMLSALQFPLKLSFACTSHKMQGATVCKPEPLVLDLRGIMEPSQGYVMLSRVQALSQLFIVGEVPRQKIFPSPIAMKELERLEQISLNDTEKNIRARTLLTSLNIRSLPKHIADLRNDFKMTNCKMICIQETWCSDIYNNNHLNIECFKLHFTNQGKGKGVANYYKDYFKLTGEVNTVLFQMTKFSCNHCDIVNVYHSQSANTESFISNLNMLIADCSTYYIVGDFNIDLFVNSKHPIVTFIISHGFQQLVIESTHESGSLLDYAFVKASYVCDYASHWPYYSDHAAICLVPVVFS